MPPMTDEERDRLIHAAIEGTKADFAGEVAKNTSLKQEAVLKLAETPEERQALARVLAAVGSATESNEAKASAIRSIAGGVEALVKIAGIAL
jgi:hypothetical protein